MKLRKINFQKETIPHNRNASYLQMRRTASHAGRLSWASLAVCAWRKAQAIGARRATAPELNQEKARDT